MAVLRLALAAALFAAMATTGATAQSSDWRVSGGQTAWSCISGTDPQICVVVTCQSGAPLVSFTGLPVEAGQTVLGSVTVDDWSRPANFVGGRLGGAQNFRDELSWTIVPRQPHRLAERIRLGGTLSVDLGSGPLVFGLRGSGRSIGTVERRCPAG